MHLRIHRVGRSIHVLPSFAFQRALDAAEVEASDEVFLDDLAAEHFLRQHFHGADEIGSLRVALLHDLCDVTRMDDDEIVVAAARRLRSGAWRVGQEPAAYAVFTGIAWAASAQPLLALLRFLRRRDQPRLQAAAPYLVHLAAGSPTTNRLLDQGGASRGAF